MEEVHSLIVCTHAHTQEKIYICVLGSSITVTTFQN